MQPPIERRLAALEERREKLLDGYADLADEQLRYRPQAGAWSLLEVAEHLLIAERGSLAAMEKRTGEPPSRTFRQKLMGGVVAAVLKLGIKVKVPSRRLAPLGEMSLEELRREWERVGLGFRSLLSGLTEEEIAGEAFRHPISGPLDFRQGLDFLCAHFDHHLRQVGRIRRSPGFAGGASPGE